MSWLLVACGGSGATAEHDGSDTGGAAGAYGTGGQPSGGAEGNTGGTVTHSGGAGGGGTGATDSGGSGGSGGEADTGGSGGTATGGGGGAETGGSGGTETGGSGGTSTGGSGGTETGGSGGTSTGGSGGGGTGGSGGTSTGGSGGGGTGGGGSNACVIHVKPTGQDSHAGASWSDAKQTIQAAIDSASAAPGKCDVWVAAGTYKPTYQQDPFADARTATLLLRDGVAVFGGFAGNEVQLDQRDISAAPTILSGELGVSGKDGNLFHVVTTEAISDAAEFRLDGFTVRDGNAPPQVAPKAFGGGAYCVRGHLALANNTFLENTANRGGAVAGEAACHLEVSDSSFENNLAAYHVNNFEAGGGAIATLGGALLVSDSTFRANRAYESKDYGTGGAIWSEGEATVKRSRFEDNEAAISGGAIRLAGAELHVDDCDFDDNRATTGGAIYGDRKSAGAAIYTAWVNDSRFTGNSAAGTSTPFGGAIRVLVQYLRVSSSTFHRNDASSGGGAVYSNIATTFDDTLFTENTSAGGAALGSVGDLTIRTSTFRANTVTASASSNGAIRMHSTNGVLTVKDSSFVANLKGRAITYDCTATSGFPCKMRIDGVTFVENTSPAKGGAVLLNASNSGCIDASIVNSAFVANQSTGDGGAVANQACASISLSHDTFFGNHSGARGGAIFDQSGQLAIVNSILWGNSAVSQGAQAFNETGVTLTLSYSNVEGIPGGSNGNISADPLFVSTTSGAVDLHLQNGSPSIDTGSNAALAVDLADRDGDNNVTELTPYDLAKAARVLGAATDMGAYER